jgi:hypothetical protein
MQMLSDDDQNLRGMTREELDAAWDLWFDLAQWTNEFDPPYEHGVFAGVTADPGRPTSLEPEPPASSDDAASA